MNMIAYPADKDSFLINANDSFALKDDYDQIHMQECLDNDCPCQQMQDPLMIIYDGKLIMYTLIDKSTEFPLAYIEKGAIINA